MPTLPSGKPDIKVVEAVDTAGAAEIISRKQMAGHAAICHADAAPLYGMKVLEQGIEDNKHNYTRFLVMSDPGGRRCFAQSATIIEKQHGLCPASR